VLVTTDPLLALQSLARTWRRELGATVIGVTARWARRRRRSWSPPSSAQTRSSRPAGELQTEIGLPLELIGVPAGTEVVVLELAMRAAGQIAELTAICEPDVGVVTNIGPVHLEQLGSLEGIGRAKGELLVGMRDGATAVVPANEELLAGSLRDALNVVTFGGGREAEVAWLDPGRLARVGEEEVPFELPFTTGPQLTNALAALAAARAVGAGPTGPVAFEPHPLRGRRITLDHPSGAVVVNDCYNASPPSMRAALDELALEAPVGRRVAVLGDMLELGPASEALHREVGAQAAASGVELLVAVGPRAAVMLDGFDGGEAHAVADAAEAAELAQELIGPGDLVLVKASNGVGLWAVADALTVAAGGSA
jgi:UDP-N-acetylmuramoyl-tripeptide--D-alanyl-D-alanine ligase